MHVAHYDHRMSRLLLDAAGYWDLAEAIALYTEVTMACRETRRAGATLAIMADLTDYLPQDGEVAEVHARTVAEIARTPISRYVLVADKAFNRMYLRRLLGDVPFEIAATREDAVARLGWGDNYLRRLPALDRSNLLPFAPHVARTSAYIRAA